MDGTVKKRLSEIIVGVIDCDADELLNSNPKLRDLGFDSISLIELQVEIEDEFEFLFDAIEDDFDEIFFSFESLCKYVMGRL